MKEFKILDRFKDEREAMRARESLCHAPIDYARGYYGKPKRKKGRSK